MNSNTKSDNNSINELFYFSQNAINECFNCRCDNWNNQNIVLDESNNCNIYYPFKADEYSQDEKPHLNDLENNMKINSNSNKSTAPFIPIEKTQKSFYNLNDNTYSSKSNNYKQIEINMNVKIIEETKSKKKKKSSKIINKSKKKSEQKDEKPTKGKDNIFKVYNPKHFKIFHSGSHQKYPRNLINSIKQGKIDITLAKRETKKKIRKYNKDNVMTRFKSRFHKSLKNSANERLKMAGSIHLFGFLPHSFIGNVSKSKNRGIMNMTIKDLFAQDFSEEENNNEEINLKNNQENILLIKYLEENEIISEKSNYKYYKNMKYYEVIYEYLNSIEFEEDIIKLEEEGEDEEYIKLYIHMALNYVDYYSSSDSSEN